ncbi:biopolymer transport protein ExbB [Pseudoalteromonas ulvae UL12]|uniref:MotA/TolQ/ExbB proton channel family protein n=1 Tax=Pseudoalteromonas ulvae TaxID=107327 RepID=UPI00186B837F|nr:MotA/TolQ/ExbB proton channel family protein [Pseudoalteromonas ulvae]MBE0364671.1 biopolymer transport protein ExbB [Pseudoalteromonas ulvae UL12]
MNKHWFGFIVLPLALCSVFAQGASPQQGLIDDIQQAQRNLVKTEQAIYTKSSQYAKQIQQLETKVLALQQQTAVARRAADEQTLSFEQLQTRLKEWRQQDSYQNNQLQRFAQQAKLREINAGADLTAMLAKLSEHLGQLVLRSSPTFTPLELALSDGQLTQVQSLSLGPVHWYIDSSTGQGGLYQMKNEIAQVALAFDRSDSEQLQRLQQGSSGKIMFDPTLDRALTIKIAEESLWDHIQKGGVWVLPILIFGVFALFISFAKSIQLWRLPAVQPALSTRLAHIFAQKDQQSVNQELAQLKSQLGDSMQGQLLDITANTKIGPSRDDQLFAALLHHKHRLDYWLGAIAITAAVAPLLGLLGTVSGMIETFKLMTLFGAGDPAAVSGGISEALVTTELGLVVAIPALLCHALLSRRAKTYYGDLESCAVNLSQLGAVEQSTLKEAA